MVKNHLTHEISPGTTKYSLFLSCMKNLFVSKPHRLADRVAYRKTPYRHFPNFLQCTKNNIPKTRRGMKSEKV